MSERLLLAAPMRVEARLVAWGARGAHVHRTGMGPRRAIVAAGALRQAPGDALAVIGFCGALHGGLQPGEVVVAERVHTPGDEEHPEADVACAGVDALCEALAGAGLIVRRGAVVCVGRIAVGERRDQLLGSGAVAVDMESAWLAEGAAGRPFAVVRVVLDTPERELLRPQMVPTAVRAGAVLRRTAQAMQRVVVERGLHTLFGSVPGEEHRRHLLGGESEV